MDRAFAEEREASELIRRLLNDAASHYTDESCPGGCLIISAAVSVTDANSHIANRLRDMRNANVAMLSQRIAADIANGLMPADSDPEDLAEFISAVTHVPARPRRCNTETIGTRSDEVFRLTELLEDLIG